MNKKGFTIIELVVVMAVIAILFVIAVSGLLAVQSSQRDTEREHFGALVNQALDDYQNKYNTIPDDNNFVGTASSYFINTASICKKDQISIDGSCVSLDGLTFGKVFYTCANPLVGHSLNQNSVYLCWNINRVGGKAPGVNGYQLGVYLENASLYWIAQ